MLMGSTSVYPRDHGRLPTPPRPATSFPFLAIARRFEVSYAYVLFIAGEFERGGISTGRDPMMAVIADAVAGERERRKLVTASV